MKVWLVCLLLLGSFGVSQATKPHNPELPKASQTLLASFLGANPRAAGVGGGNFCVGCTAIVSIVEQLAYIHNAPLVTEMEKFCTRFPGIVERSCDAFVEKYGAAIINLLELEETPDRVCQTLGICTMPECTLFPPPKSSQETLRKRAEEEWRTLVKPTPEDWEPLSWIDRVFDDHLPGFDLDGDKFSNHGTLRGSMWRGKDCDDLKKHIYPGRKNSTFPVGVDHDCNGIYGHALNGTAWEDLLCADTPRFGTVVLGDSASAHFHVPPEYCMPEVMNDSTFDDLLHIIENEFDWPMMSATSGYTNNDWHGHPRGPVSSIYELGMQRNRCAFRDFQNIGVNGARTSSMASDIMYTLARDQENDYPVSLLYALIGNDVCNPHPNFDHMTKPDDFYNNVVAAMDYLDTQLPNGSHVLFMGLADGLVLYDSLNARIHPLGQLRQDVTYADLYNFLNCLHVSPCWGWLNANETIRNETQAWADSLSAVYDKVIANNTYTHFDMHYIDCPIRQIVNLWESQGGQAWELIEPTDGFHPNQIGNALIANYLWEVFEKQFPFLIPPENPHNAEIEKIFGDQGGY